MIKVRRSAERGHFDFGWLDTHHTFSFADYYDPRFMGFRSLRVINEDWVEPGRGFGTHGHRDMEIITYVLEGALEHRDSMGNGSVLRPGEVQRMSAGTGVLHSEFNHSRDERVHLLQIWILPEREGMKPSYEEKTFDASEKRGRLRLVASREGSDSSVRINQDAKLYAALLEPGETVTHRLAPGRHAWLQVARGAVELNGHALRQGDGAAVSEEETLSIVGAESSEVLLFDLD
ncbi:MAG TPA: pirin family protein [Pyrinomonadaceae bacterium]|nr:pirin family protein [Pyrinomonadaceae bacterium]